LEKAKAAGNGKVVVNEAELETRVLEVKNTFFFP
jgi:hypothetical protein